MALGLKLGVQPRSPMWAAGMPLLEAPLLRLRVHMSRQLESGAELGIRSRDSSLGCVCVRERWLLVQASRLALKWPFRLPFPLFSFKNLTYGHLLCHKNASLSIVIRYYCFPRCSAPGLPDTAQEWCHQTRYWTHWCRKYCHLVSNNMRAPWQKDGQEGRNRS